MPTKNCKMQKKQKRQCWDEHCRRLKGIYITPLEKKQCTELARDKADTAAKKKEYHQKLKS